MQAFVVRCTLIHYMGIYGISISKLYGCSHGFDIYEKNTQLSSLLLMGSHTILALQYAGYTKGYTL